MSARCSYVLSAGATAILVSSACATDAQPGDADSSGSGSSSTNGRATTNGGATGGATSVSTSASSSGATSGGTTSSGATTGSSTASTDGTGGAITTGGGSEGVTTGGARDGGNATTGSTGSMSSATSGTAGATGSGSSGSGTTTGATTGGTSTGGGGTTGTTGVGTVGPLIHNDTFWKDTSGTPIYSQGGGVLRVGDTYYWYGVKYGGAVTYAAQPTPGANPADDTSFQGITTYSSTDLVNWKLETTSKPANAFGWFGRLGVVYHAATKKYVLVAQVGSGQLYFATSDSPKGPFTYASSQSNLPGIANGSTGDQTMFQDDDGTAYLVASSSNGRGNRYLSPLRTSDYLAVENAILVYSGGGREGNCMFKYDGTYYFCSSDLHGWNASHTYCVTSSSTHGPWSAEFVMDGTDNDFSHVTQTGFFISVQGTQATTIIFAGDRWSDFAGNGIGFNQWVPLTFTGKTPHFQSLSLWSINAQAGTWAVAPGNNYALNPSFEADRVSITIPAGWKATNGSNVQGGHTGRWAWQLAGSSSLEQSLSNLPNGTYTLSAWIKSTGGQSTAQLYAKGFGGTEKDAALDMASTAWSQKTIAGIAVSNGQSQIGVTTTGGAGQSVTIDDIELVRTGP